MVKPAGKANAMAYCNRYHHETPRIEVVNGQIRHETPSVKHPLYKLCFVVLFCPGKS
jgi:hypothetical protein